jgi:tape measure domain-containing protein
MAENILEYVLSLKDQVSSKLRIIGVNNDLALEKFSKLQRQSNDVAKEFKYLGTNVTTLQSKISLLKSERDMLPIDSLSAIRKYNSEIKKLEGNVTKLQSLNGSKVKTWFKDALNGLPGIATNPLVLLGAGIGKSVKNGMEADMQKANILTLLKGDADKAKQLFQDLSNYGIKSPYDKAGLIEAQQTMMSFGINADTSFEKLKQIGDIAMGDAQKMQSLSLAFAQASSTGKLNGQDLNQMINAGFNPLLVISEATGESMTSLKERMSKGAIGIDEVSKAFEIATSEGGDFYKAAENASNTLGGKWSNMMEALSELSLKVYEVVQPIISPLIGLVTSLVESIGSGIGWLINKIKEGNPIIIGIATVVGIFTAALILHNTYTAIATTFQNKLTIAVWKSNLAFLANPITWLIAGIIALIAFITYLIFKIDGWGDAWKHTVNGAKLLFSAFVEHNKWAFNTMVDGIMIGINKIKLGWYKFKNAVGMGDKSENNKMIEQIKADTENRKKAIIEGAQKVKDLYVGSKNEFVQAGKSLKWNDKSLGDITGELKAKVGISDPKTPGIAPVGQTSDGTGTGKGQASKSNESIATGGQKNTTINITFKNMVEAMNITGKDFKESANNMSTELQDQMARVLAMAVTTAG